MLSNQSQVADSADEKKAVVSYDSESEKRLNELKALNVNLKNIVNPAIKQHQRNCLLFGVGSFGGLVLLVAFGWGGGALWAGHNLQSSAEDTCGHHFPFEQFCSNVTTVFNCTQYTIQDWCSGADAIKTGMELIKVGSAIAGGFIATGFCFATRYCMKKCAKIAINARVVIPDELKSQAEKLAIVVDHRAVEALMESEAEIEKSVVIIQENRNLGVAFFKAALKNDQLKFFNTTPGIRHHVFEYLDCPGLSEEIREQKGKVEFR